MANLLLVEDDTELAELTAEFLTSHGHTVQIDDGLQALELVRRSPPDLLILDVELPGETGFGICMRARQAGFQGPVLFLTARHSETDELLSFELGADDFVRKPVDPRVLALRVEAALRRGAPGWQDGVLAIDPRARRVTVDGNELALSTGQFDLLWLLAGHAGKVVDRHTYYKKLRGIAYDGVDRGYDSRIRELRARLETVGLEHRIVTVRGLGYLLSAES